MELEGRVSKACKGDADAFYEIMTEVKEILYKTAFIYVKNQHNALEIVSETTYRAYKSIRKLKEPKYFRTWITRILINCCLDYLNKNRTVILEEEARVEEFDTGLEGIESKLDLYTAVNQLNDKKKIVLILKYFHGMTLSEISQVLNCPMGTVKTYLHTALKELRIELEEEFCNE